MKAQHLHDDVEARITSLETITEQVETEAPAVLTITRKACTADSRNPGLISISMTSASLRRLCIYADRSDITEELTR